ncbi:response regulator transcription factor [Myceligenerans crystallogenes]|uniref:Response regulator transcription factor n=1 Tax=Myceligenerans crystallogenes TaxID=316335 RepID=A0ABN2NFA8_9MICO
MSDESVVKVGVVAHHELLVTGIANLITACRHLRVVGKLSAVRPAPLRRWVLETKPDVVVSADRIALSVLDEASRVPTPPSVVVLASADGDPGPEQFIAAGVSALLHSGVSTEELVRAVRLAASGHQVVNTALAPELVAAMRQWASFTEMAGLTSREREILHDIGDGLTNIQISSRRNISVGTVKVHIRALKAKTGVDHRAELIALVHGSALNS